MAMLAAGAFLAFIALWVSGKIVWRVAVAMIARIEIRALKALYLEAMDELARTSRSSTATTRDRSRSARSASRAGSKTYST